MQLDAYLQRIGYAGDLRPSAAVLEALHLAHATHIPFENLDILRGLPIRLDLESLQRKLVDARRGGYCFEQNLLFAAVLEEVGFAVTRLAARVRYRTTDASFLARTCCCWSIPTRADGSPTSALAPRDCCSRCRLIRARSRSSLRGRIAWRRRGPEWVLQSKHAEGWADMYGFTLEPQLQVDYEVANHFTSTHPESRFVKGLTVQLPTPEARTALRNRELSVDDGQTMTARVLGDAEEIRRAIEETFGLPAPPDLRIPC